MYYSTYDHVLGGFGLSILLTPLYIFHYWVAVLVAAICVTAFSIIREHGQNKQWWGVHTSQPFGQMLRDTAEHAFGSTIYSICIGIILGVVWLF